MINRAFQKRVASLRTVFLVLALLLSITVLQARTWVKTEMGTASRISCDKPLGNILIVGSVGSLTVTALDEKDTPPFTGFPTEQPGWLHLEFSYGNDHGQFVPSAVLYGLLNPVYYLNREQIRVNELFRQNETVDPIATVPVYHFRFDLPEALAGKQICVRAVLTPPPFGEVDARNNRDIACGRIMSPCSEEDRDLAMAWHVIMAYWAGDDARVMVLTDSLLQTGWKHRMGIAMGLNAALTTKNPQLSLRFLDALYTNYGVTMDSHVGPGPEEEQRYHQMREQFQQQIENQKEQQK